MSRAILWFRLNLRLHDNEALIQAVKSNPKALFPVFTIDPHYAVKVRVGIRRWQFLLETLEDLDKSLRSIGSRLIVCRGNPMELFPQLVTEWSITHLFMMSENQGGWSVERDASLCDMMEKLGVKTLITEGHNLYSLTKIVELNKGKPPLTYTSFLSVIKKLPQPAASAPAPTELPPVDQPCLNGSLKDVMLDTTVGDHVNHRDPINVEQREVMFKRMAGPNGNFDVPKIIEFGFQTLPIEDQSPHRGGETEALKRLTAYMAQKDKVAKFEKPKTSPAAFNPADTTVLSPYLKFGALSCRLFYHNIMEIYLQKLKHSQPPVSLLGQLLWRDFYYVIAYHTPNYHKMQGNSVCLQIDWWCREGSVDPENETATKNLVAWSEARTGYPWIDAIMTQLRKEGWIHHLARHSTACFLTRGDLFISWERGAEVFEELLLDHDPALISAIGFG
ncbi:FAD binding domain of DNA photolyase-domain-containing protein [Chytridium lagenaria]|nr:FAD binding domain of DNA photolyase-domain-containing protein [Chytridium lagenaria]